MAGKSGSSSGKDGGATPTGSGVQRSRPITPKESPSIAGKPRDGGGGITRKK